MDTDSTCDAGADTAGAEIADFYEQYRRPLLAYLTRIVGNRDTAEELCQDSFVKVLRHWPQRDQQKKEREWLYRIATNTAITYIRRVRRSPALPPQSPRDL